jgi:hypothetical protein
MANISHPKLIPGKPNSIRFNRAFRFQITVAGGQIEAVIPANQTLTITPPIGDWDANIILEYKDEFRPRGPALVKDD